MGAYNVLNANVPCSFCRNIYEGRIQFKYGDTWQHQYTTGDKILWGGNDIGVKCAIRVIAFGILELEECPVCRHDNLNNQFEIYIENNIIKSVSTMKEIRDSYPDDGTYIVLG